MSWDMYDMTQKVQVIVVAIVLPLVILAASLWHDWVEEGQSPRARKIMKDWEWNIDEMAHAVEYQCCNFLLRLLTAPGIAVFHHEESNVHHGILADAFVKTDVLVVSALDLLIHVHRNSLQKIIFWCGDRYIPPDHADSAVQNSLSVIIIPRHNSQFQPLIERIRRGAERLCHSAQKSKRIFSQMIQQKYDWFMSHSCLPFLFHL